MKVKTIITCLLALVLAIPANDAYAQTRKKGSTTRKTATSAAKSTSISKKSPASTTKPLSLEQVNDFRYYGMFLEPDLKKLGKDVGFYTYLFLYPNDMRWYLLENKFEGTFSVASNTLSVKSGGIGMDLTSPDGGKTLTGTFYNPKGVKIPMAYYQV